MEGKSGGLLAVITGSIVMVAASWLAITYSGGVGRIAKSTVGATSSLARVWQG